MVEQKNISPSLPPTLKLPCLSQEEANIEISTACVDVEDIVDIVSSNSTPTIYHDREKHVEPLELKIDTSKRVSRKRPRKVGKELCPVENEELERSKHSIANQENTIYKTINAPLSTSTNSLSPYTHIPPSPVHSVVSHDGDEHGCELPKRMKVSPSRCKRNDIITHNKSRTHISKSPQEIHLHMKSLCIEANLAPMKPLLFRLITHQAYNRKGTFNQPVDSIALGLKDYNDIIKKPMDLGTVKTKLLSNLYSQNNEGIFNGRDQVANDIRLVFNNACLFNPPNHPVHEAAKNLLIYFEEHFDKILKKVDKEIKNSSEDRNGSCPELSSLSTLNHCPTMHEDGTKVISSNREGQTSAHHLNKQNEVKLLREQQQSLTLPPIKHSCKACLGRTCFLCKEGCLSLEPSLLICSGAACAGTKIRRGIHYYSTIDGNKTWCHKCHSSLPAVLPCEEGETGNVHSKSGRLLKRDLLKRKNEEDVVEKWISCSKCQSPFHEICVFANEFFSDHDEFVCPLCTKRLLPMSTYSLNDITKRPESNDRNSIKIYSYVTGKELPELVEDFVGGTPLTARALRSCNISSFIESKLRRRMIELDCPKNAEKTITVRIISDHDKVYNVPDVVSKHFRSQQMEEPPPGMENTINFQEPSSSIPYRSKAISLYQRIDGMDVCIFMMFVQEYEADPSQDSEQSKRVYIAYIDSIEHFQPRSLRTNIYHELLVAYLATARARGFQFAHIWSCPPTRGNCFVFWSHPSSQRTPTKERLLSWYYNALSIAAERGIVTGVKSLYEHSFQQFDKNHCKAKGIDIPKSVMASPAILDGDFWIEEASRVYNANISRGIRAKPVVNDLEEITFDPSKLFLEAASNCPAIQVTTLIRDFFMRHTLSAPFHRPVDAVALGLSDYHDKIDKPMDLGTIVKQCLSGEYDIFSHVTRDLKLVFENAMKYNPKGHVVHHMAEKLWEYVRVQLSVLAKYWNTVGIHKSSTFNANEDSLYSSFGEVSMRLSTILKLKSDVVYDVKRKHESTTHTGSSTVIPPCKRDVNDIKFPSSDKCDLLFGGPDGISKLMVGEDVWLLDKRFAQKEALRKKKKKALKKKSSQYPCPETDHSRESWLSDSVLATVRRLRTDFFVCRLSPKAHISLKEREKGQAFLSYIEDFETSCSPRHPNRRSQSSSNPRIAETRNGLLEFSQYCHLQFDTIRRAKYSTAMLLFYLQNPDTPGIIPTCTQCKNDIIEVRWRRVNKAFDERRRNSLNLSIRNACVEMGREEVCRNCFDKLQTEHKDDFIPIRVTFMRSN